MIIETVEYDEGANRRSPLTKALILGGVITALLALILLF